jgi:uncharacterized delta-60 repeat protein
MLRVSQFHRAIGLLTALIAAVPLRAQSPQWVTRLNDVAYAQDWVTAALMDEQGNGFLAGYNDTGWTAWKIAPGGSIEWYWHGAGLLRRDDEPRIAGMDAAGNLYLVSGSSYGITIVRVAPDGQSASVRHHDTQANLNSATVTADGVVYAAGSFSPALHMTDVFLARFDRDGEMMWSATYDGPASDYDAGAAVAIGPTGDVYVAGRAEYRSISTQTLRSGGLVLRYTPAGDLIWESLTEFDPDAQYESLYSATLAIDSAGNAYVAGWKSSSGHASGIIFKVAADGTPLWHDGPLDALFTANEGRNPRVLLDEPRGAVYLAGDVRITDTDSDFVLHRYALNGSEPWTASYDGPAHTRDNVLDAGLDAAGHVHLIGTSYADVDNPDLTDVQFDSDGQVVSVGRSDNEASKYDRVRVGAIDLAGHALIVGGAFGEYFDSRVARLDPAGQVEWTTMLRSTVASADEFTDAAVDATGSIYATGTSNRQRSLENPAVLVRYSPTGDLEWKQRLPDRFNDPGAVVVDPSGNALVVTEYGNDLDTPMGLLKYAPDGTLLWSNHHRGPDRLEWLRSALAIDPHGNLAMCGSVEYRDGTGYLDSNGLVVFVDASGELRWSHELAGSRDEHLFALAVDTAGSVTVAGNSSQTDIGTPKEIVVIRYGPNGFGQWQQRFSRPDSTDSDGAATVNLAPDGTAYITATRGSWRVAQWASVLCYADDGTLRWVRDFVGGNGESVRPREARLDLSGNLVVLCELESPNHTYDVLLLCYAPDGTLLWTHRQAGARNFTESAKMLEISPTGDLLVTAQMYSGTDYEQYNSMLLRLDSSGVPRWTSRHSPPGELAGFIRSLIALSDGGFVIAGQIAPRESRGDGVVARFGPPPPPCPVVDTCAGDLNADCRVELADLAIVLSTFGSAPAEGFAPQNGDVDMDGDVDLQDLTIVLSAWGSDCR